MSKVKGKSLFSKNKRIPVGSNVLMFRPSGKDSTWQIIDRIHEKPTQINTDSTNTVIDVTPPREGGDVYITNFQWSPDNIVMDGNVDISFDYEQDSFLIEKFDIVRTWRLDDHNYVTPDEIGLSGTFEYSYHQGYNGGDYTYNIEIYCVLKNGERILCGTATYDYENIQNEDIILGFDTINGSDVFYNYYSGENVPCLVELNPDFAPYVYRIKIRWENDCYEYYETNGASSIYVNHTYGDDMAGWLFACVATAYSYGNHFLDTKDIEHSISITRKSYTEWRTKSYVTSGNNVVAPEVPEAYDCEYLPVSLYNSHAFSIDMQITGVWAEGVSKTIMFGGDLPWDGSYPSLAFMQLKITCFTDIDNDNAHTVKAEVKFSNKYIHSSNSHMHIYDAVGNSGEFTARALLTSDGVYSTGPSILTDLEDGTECPEKGECDLTLNEKSNYLSSKVRKIREDDEGNPVNIYVGLVQSEYGFTSGPIWIFGEEGEGWSASFEIHYHHPYTVY